MRLKSIGNVGQIVRDLRKSKRLTQGQLAAKVDTNQEWISNLETGRIQNPSLGTILRAFDVLGIHLIVEIQRDGSSDGRFDGTGPEVEETPG